MCCNHDVCTCVYVTMSMVISKRYFRLRSYLANILETNVTKTVQIFVQIRRQVKHLNNFKPSCERHYRKKHKGNVTEY